MDTLFFGSGVTALAGIGVVVGLFLLARGVDGYRSFVRVGDTSTSTIASLAAGEVRVSGVIETAELTLVSLLQSVPCIYYRSTVEAKDDRDRGYTEERSIGFRVRDASGSLRVFPRGARFDAPVRFEGETDLLGGEPSALDIRRGGATAATQIDRAAAELALLTVQGPGTWPSQPSLRGSRGHGRKSYREVRLEPGDAVTIVGRAIPFSDLADPSGADIGTGTADGLDDPEVAADLAAARARGQLADDAATAWGNAAIPGFGIGRPVSTPTIDSAADVLPLAEPDAAAEAARTFEIKPETLVMAAVPGVPLLIAHGIPSAVVGRGQGRFMVGLLGAVLAIGSAMVFAMSLGEARAL